MSSVKVISQEPPGGREFDDADIVATIKQLLKP